MGSYRNRLNIIADILHVVSGEANKKTQIMYKAILSYKLLTKYLTEVIDACLVRFERKEGCYVITSKGREFLETYKTYSRRNKHLEKTLNDLHDKRKVLEGLCSNG